MIKVMRRARGEAGQNEARGIAIIVALAVAALVLAASGIMFIAGWKAVPVDKIGLHYTGGPVDGQKFVKLIEPGSGTQFLGLLEKLVELPVTQRDYTFCFDTNKCDGAPIEVAVKGGSEVILEGATTFKLNAGPDTIRRFYEQICIKFDCTSEDGWDEMLRVNMRGPIEQAIQQSVRAYTMDEVYAGVPGEGATTTADTATTILEQVQAAIAADLKENINTFVGGPYFCGPSYDRSRPDDCPDFQFQITNAIPKDESVRNSFAANVASRQNEVTARNNAAAKVAEAEGQRRAQEALGSLFAQPGYIEYLRALAMQRCAENSNCTLVLTDGAGVNVNTTPR